MYLLLLLSSYSIPVASSTLVVVDLCCTAIVSHSVTVTVMLKRQRHSGSFFSCFTDSPECPQCFTHGHDGVVTCVTEEDESPVYRLISAER